MKHCRTVLFIILTICSIGLHANESEEDSGKKLFLEHCAKCHKIGKEMTGPDLSHVQERRTKEWLISFIRNSKDLIEKKDPVALELFESYEQTDMPAVDLSNEEILDILDYISKTSVANQSQVPKIIPPSSKIKSRFVPYSLIVFSLLVVMIGSMALVAKKQDKGFLFILKQRVSKTFYVFTGLPVLIVFLFWGKNDLQRFRDHQLTYTLSQPIEFSHKIHYEDYDIDCIYCHVKATNNDIANIPALENCMKCHDYIEEGALYGKQEIDKIYQLVDQNIPVEWNKGYRLKAFTHFSHQMHTQIAGLDCIDCHQNTDTQVITQNSFGMKWCIDCHKQSQVQIANKYYTSLLADSIENEGVKLSNFGGLDCNACHY